LLLWLLPGYALALDMTARELQAIAKVTCPIILLWNFVVGCRVEFQDFEIFTWESVD
jgi:hypothetical protein